MKYLRIKTILLVFLLLLLNGCSMGSLMVKEKPSPYAFDKTVDVIVSNAQSQGWSVPKVYDFQALLIEKGEADPGKIKVIKLCKAGIAGRMLKPDDNKYMGAMMPCSVAVYEKQDGKTYVSSMNMSLMATMIGGDAGEILTQVASEEKAILQFLHE
jgi:uncharacterized protein (DUF302 family)